MKNTERYWWAEALVGMLVLLGAPVWLNWALSPLPPVSPYFTADERNQLIAVIVAVTALLVGMGLFFLAMALRDWRRMRLRWAALRGDLDAMPLARFVPDASKAPDVAAEPLVISWRMTRTAAITFGIPLLFCVLVILIEAVGAPLFGWFILFTGKHAQVKFDGTTIVGIAFLILGPPIGVIMVVVIARMLPTLFGRPFGVTATMNGIERRTEFGGRRFLGWEDIRLFEVESDGLIAAATTDHFYCVYGNRRRVDWHDSPGQRGEYKPLGISSDEMARRHARLLDLIYARTGLAPRTLTKSLQIAESATDVPHAPVAPRAVRNAWFTWTSAVIALVLAALTAGAAAAAVMLPASPYEALNLAIAASLTLSALALVVVVGWIVVRIMTRDHVSPLLQAPVVRAPALDVTTRARSLTYTLTPLVRAALIVGGALLLPNLVPPLLLFGNLGLNLLRPLSERVFTASPLAPLFSSVLMLPGLAGLVMLKAGLQEGRAQVRADTQGISRSLGRRITTLRWDGVEKVEGWSRSGRIVRYLLTGELGAIRVGWRTRSSWFLRLVAPPGAETITPDELAALAARESGKPLRIEPEA